MAPLQTIKMGAAIGAGRAGKIPFNFGKITGAAPDFDNLTTGLWNEAGGCSDSPAKFGAVTHPITSLKILHVWVPVCVTGGLDFGIVDPTQSIPWLFVTFLNIP